MEILVRLLQDAERGGDLLMACRARVRVAELLLRSLELCEAGRWLEEALGLQAGEIDRLEPDRIKEKIKRLVVSFPAGLDADREDLRSEARTLVACFWAAKGAFAPAQAVLTDIGPLLELSEATMDRALLRAGFSLDYGDLRGCASIERAVEGAATDPGVKARLGLLRARRLRLAGTIRAALDVVVAIDDVDQQPTDAGWRARLERLHLLSLLNRVDEGSKLSTDAMEIASTRGEWIGFIPYLRLAARGFELRGKSVAEAIMLPPPPEVFLGVARRNRSSEDAPEPDDWAGKRAYLGFFDEWSNRATEVLDRLARVGQRSRVELEWRPIEAALETLVALGAQTDSPLLRSKTATFQALVAHHTGDHPRALELLEVPTNYFAAEGMRYELRQSLELQRRAAGAAGEDTVSQAALSKIRAIDRAIESSLPAELAGAYALNKMTSEDLEVEALLFQRRHVLDAMEGEAGWLARLRALIARELFSHNCFKRIGRLVGWAARAEVLQSPLLGARWAPARIPRHTALLQYYVLPQATVVAVLAGWRARVFVHPFGRVELDRALRRVLETSQLQRSAIGSKAFAELARVIGLAEIEAALPITIQRLIIVPHDAIINVPFAALPLKNGKLLCERFAVQLLPSVSLCVPRRRHGRHLHKFVGVAVTDYPDAAGALPSLSGAVAEVDAIVEALPQSMVRQVLKDGGATREAILACLPDVDLAHFACHGVVEANHGRRVSLVVSGSREGATERIRPDDLRALKLRSQTAVVLGACWGASAVVLPGNETVSLPAAILKAGAGTVVGCLWPVEERRESEEAGESVVHHPSRQFMVELYRHASTHGLVEALAMTQAHFARHPEHALSDAWTWAGFQSFSLAL